jgi:hypothetical protein
MAKKNKRSILVHYIYSNWMSYLSKKIKQINGPINVVRLEGKFNNIKKVLYVFMDFHMPVSAETVCDNVFRKDIEEYFAESFYDLNSSSKMYDFFLETWEMNFINVNFGLPYKTKLNYKGMYIEEVIKLFRKLFVYEPNKAHISKIFKNIRLHYLDIRTFFEESFYFEFHDMIHLANEMRMRIDINMNYLTAIINFLKKFIEYCHFIEDIINDIKSAKKSTINKVNIIEFTKNINADESIESREKKRYDLFIYLINKMYNLYKHAKVKQFARQEIDIIMNDLNDLIMNSENALSEFSKILDIYNNVINNTENNLFKDPYTGLYNYGIPDEIRLDMCNTIYIKLYRLAENLRHYFIRFMDIYFMRRFLDKDYITNAIAYTGAGHSIIYIDILCKKFDFKVTHFYYSKIPDLTILNSEIKKTSTNDSRSLFFPPFLSQCSDITNFPEKFE